MEDNIVDKIIRLRKMTKPPPPDYVEKSEEIKQLKEFVMSSAESIGEHIEEKIVLEMKLEKIEKKLKDTIVDLELVNHSFKQDVIKWRTDSQNLKQKLEATENNRQKAVDMCIDLKEELKEITASCDKWCRDALKYKKQIVYLKELNNGLNYQKGLDDD